MSKVPAHRAFFGDRERDFALPAPLVKELENLTGTGFYALANRIIARQCSYGDVTETIRLAMIGGGEHPERGAELVAVYVPTRPLIEAYGLAVDILSTILMGESDGDDEDDAADSPEDQS